MRFLLLSTLLLLSVNASAHPPHSANRTPPPLPLLRAHDELLDPSASPVCRDRIDMAREERGLPKLSQDQAARNAPLFIAAVDRRVGGCSVLVMRNNLSDIRPLPQFQNGPAQLSPLKAQ